MSYSSKYFDVCESSVTNIGFSNFFRDIKRDFELNINQIRLFFENNELLATSGKIEVNFDSSASWELISNTLIAIADIDKNAQHEVSVEMNYDQIEEHEKEGYVLVSYGKIKGDLYKVIFEIPFSNNSALRKLALTIYNSKEKTKKDIIWHGGNQRIISLYDKLSEHGWKIDKLELIKDKKIIVEFSDDGLKIEEFKKKLSKSVE